MYATFEDIAKRKPVETSEMERCEALLEDAGIIIDAFNTKATAESKRLVSCNMVIRVLGVVRRESRSGQHRLPHPHWDIHGVGQTRTEAGNCT